jgi:hypothetical protein
MHRQAPRHRTQRKEKADQMAWKVHGTHVYPVNDLREHSPADCWCEPYDDDGITVHNSLDGRELYERGEKKPS